MSSEESKLAEVLGELREDLYRELRSGEDGTAYAIGAIEAIEDRLPELLAEYVATKQAEALREYRDALAANESAENWSERSDYLHDIDDWIAS